MFSKLGAFVRARAAALCLAIMAVALFALGSVQSYAVVVLPDFGITWTEYTTEMTTSIGEVIAAGLPVGIALFVVVLSVTMIKRFVGKR